MTVDPAGLARALWVGSDLTVAVCCLAFAASTVHSWRTGAVQLPAVPAMAFAALWVVLGAGLALDAVAVYAPQTWAVRVAWGVTLAACCLACVGVSWVYRDGLELVSRAEVTKLVERQLGARSLWDHSNLLVTWVDPSGVVVRQVGGATRRLPLPPEAWTGRQLDPDSQVAAILPLVLEGHHVGYRLAWTDAQGETHHWSGVAEPWSGGDGATKGALFVALRHPGGHPDIDEGVSHV